MYESFIVGGNIQTQNCPATEEDGEDTAPDNVDRAPVVRLLDPAIYKIGCGGRVGHIYGMRRRIDSP